MPPVVTGYLLLVLLGRRGVPGAVLYRHFGFTFAFTWKAAVVASAVMAFPLMVRAVRIAIEMADPKLEAAARCLGANPLRTFLTITLPLARPGIITGLVLAFARSLGEFGATIVFAGNIQGETRTLPLAVFHPQAPSASSRNSRSPTYGDSREPGPLCSRRDTRPARYTLFRQRGRSGTCIAAFRL